MIDKIIITSDFLRWSHDKMSNKWFSQLFEFYLEHVTELPVYIVGNALYNNKNCHYIAFDVEEFYSYFGVNISALSQTEKLKAWLKIFNLNEFHKKAYEYVYNIFKNSLVVGHEMSNILTNILDYYKIPYIDTNTHPIRYMDDQFFGFRSNVPEIYEKILDYQYDEINFYIFANYMKSSFVFRNCIPSLKENSVLFCGQMDIDKSIIDYKTNDIYRILEHKKEFEESIKGFDHVYVKNHPYYQMSKELNDYFNSLGNVEFTNSNFYTLVSSPQIKKVVAISSGTLIEAKYFGKQTQSLLRNSINIQNEKKVDTHKFISVYGDYWTLQFWSGILSPVIKTKKIENNQFIYLRNKLRNSRFMYWGFTDFDQEYLLEQLQTDINNIVLNKSLFTDYKGRIIDLKKRTFSKMSRIYKSINKVNLLKCLKLNVPLDKKILCNKDISYLIDLHGFGRFEHWGVWTTQSEAIMKIKVPSAKNNYSLEMKVRPFINKAKPELRCCIYVNNRRAASPRFTLEKNTDYINIPVRREWLNSSKVVISFKFELLKSPKALGLSEDCRLLGMGIEYIKLTKGK